MSGQGGRTAITAGSKIFKKVATGSAKAKTGSVRLGVATEAEGWRRPLETAPEEIGGRLKKYIEAWDQGPKPQTAEMVARYGRSDMRSDAASLFLSPHFHNTRFSSYDDSVTNQLYRDAEHASTDPQRHMTVECFDKDGNKIETVHVPAPEPKDGKK